MYPASDWSICSGPSWISAPCVSHLADRPLIGHSGHQCFALRAGRPILHSYLPLADLGWKLLIGLRHRLLLICAVPLSTQGRSFVPARRASIASRAGAVTAGRRAWLAAGSGVARPRLDRAEHGARIKRVGRRCIVGPRQLEGASFSPHRPRRCGKSVASAIASTFVVQPPSCVGFDPGFEPVTFQFLILTRTTHAACTNRTRR